VSVAKLTLDEQEIASGSFVCEKAVGVTQELHTRSLAKAGVRKDAFDTPIEPGPIEGAAALTDQPGKFEVVRPNIDGQKLRSYLTRELPCQVAEPAGYVDRSACTKPAMDNDG